MNIGKRIKEERQKRKWTQEQLGEKLNVSRSAVYSWEVGRNYPDLETIILISDLLEISLDKLLREDEEIVKDVTKKLKMNKTYKVLLGIFISLIISYAGFNIYLTKTEKKYHQNLDKNGWKIYTPNDEPGFNQFTLDEEGVHYYTTILPTGLIGYPLEEQKFKIIAKKGGLAMVIQDKKHIEIVIAKENDTEVDFKSRVKVNEELEIIDKKSDISTEVKILTEEYIKNHKKEYLDLMNKALNKVNEIKD